MLLVDTFLIHTSIRYFVQVIILNGCLQIVSLADCSMENALLDSLSKTESKMFKKGILLDQHFANENHLNTISEASSMKSPPFITIGWL